MINSSLSQHWVDLFTNQASIKNFEGWHLSKVIFGHSLPAPVFFSFVHEATHHWCFHSYVGSALFVLKNRAYQAAIKQQNNIGKSEKEVWDIFTANYKYNLLQKIIHPLIEGMALFAEFDSYPTKTEAIPTHLVYASMAFSGIEYWKEKLDIAKTEQKYIEFLYTIRLESECLSKKSELLIESIDCEKSPYLTGYLFYKNLQRLLVRKNVKFFDPNLFMYFTWAYFFNDLELVDILLDDSVRDGLVTEYLMRYFVKRIRNLKELPDSAIDDFEKNVALPNGEFEIYRFMTDKNIAQKSWDRLSNEINSTILSEKNIRGVFYMRSFFKILSTDVYLTINDDNALIEYIVDEKTVKVNEPVGFTHENGYYRLFFASFPNDLKFPYFEGIVHLRKYMRFSEFQKYFLVFTDLEGIVFVRFHGKWEADEKQLVFRHFRENFIMNEIVEGMDSIIQTSISDLRHTIKDEEEVYDKLLYNKINTYYQAVALDCDDDVLAAIKDKMLVNGFWQLLDKRMELLTILGYLSIVCSNCSKKYKDVNINKNYPLLRELDDILHKHGIDVLMIREDTIGTGGI